MAELGQGFPPHSIQCALKTVGEDEVKWSGKTIPRLDTKLMHTRAFVFTTQNKTKIRHWETMLCGSTVLLRINQTERGQHSVVTSAI